MFSRTNAPRFAPVFRNTTLCRNVRFSRLGDCDPRVCWADCAPTTTATCPRNLGLRSFYATDRVHACAGCPGHFSADELVRRHPVGFVCEACAAEIDADRAEVTEAVERRHEQDVFNGRAIYTIRGAL